MGAHCQGQAAGQRTNMLLTMQCNNMLLTVQRDNVLLGAQCSQHTAGSAVEQQAAGGAAQQHAPDGAGLLCARPCRHGWPPSGWSPWAACHVWGCPGWSTTRASICMRRGTFLGAWGGGAVGTQ